MLIAQFSDTHIKPKGRLAYNKVDTALMLRQAVINLKQLPQTPDLLLITGDLVDQGMAEEYEHLNEILESLSLPMLLVPGNHDDSQAMRKSFTNLLVEPIGEFWQFIYTQSDWPVQIIGLDTTLPGSSSGLLCEKRLKWLENTLKRVSPDIPTIVLMHHPPFNTGIGHMDEIGLSGKDQFANIVSQYPNIELITCGHLHRNIRANVGGRSVMTCPSTAHSVQLDLSQNAPAEFRMEPRGQKVHCKSVITLIPKMAGIANNHQCSRSAIKTTRGRNRSIVPIIPSQ